MIKEQEIQEEYEGLTLEEKINLVKKGILNFFDDDKLLTEKNIKVCLNTTIIEAVDLIYKKNLANEREIIDLLEKCHKKWVAKDHAGGILLIYFKQKMKNFAKSVD